MALFKLGNVVATPNALAFCEQNNVTPMQLLHRHVNGDYGDLCASDVKSNVDAIAYDDRVFSSYNIGKGKVWVITEWDRSYTTVLLPEDY